MLSDLGPSGPSHGPILPGAADSGAWLRYDADVTGRWRCLTSMWLSANSRQTESKQITTAWTGLSRNGMCGATNSTSVESVNVGKDTANGVLLILLPVFGPPIKIESRDKSRE